MPTVLLGSDWCAWPGRLVHYGTAVDDYDICHLLALLCQTQTRTVSDSTPLQRTRPPSPCTSFFMYISKLVFRIAPSPGRHRWGWSWRALVLVQLASSSQLAAEITDESAQGNCSWQLQLAARSTAELHRRRAVGWPRQDAARETSKL